MAAPLSQDMKMKKMAELQLTIEKDVKSRSAMLDQMQKWEETLESLNMDQYRYKCYLASLQVSYFCCHMINHMTNQSVVRRLLIVT